MQHDAAVQQVLRHSGTPEQIGSLYRADAMVAHARAGFSPALILRTTFRWAGRTEVGFVFLRWMLRFVPRASRRVASLA